MQRLWKKEYHIIEDRGQEIVKGKKWEELKKYRGCAKKEREKAVHPIEGKVQQSDTQARDLEGIAKERDSQRKVWKTFKMLKEVWLDIDIEKTDIHKGITIKALLDSSTTRIFMDRKTTVILLFVIGALILEIVQKCKVR